MSERKDKVSGSGIGRLKDCPGSYALESTMPKDQGNAYSESGTRIHEWIATGEGVLTPEETETANLCIHFHKEVIDTINAGNITYVTTEKRLWLGELYSGQIDRIDHIGDEIAIVSDYKTGRISQGKAEENIQLRAYAVLVKANLPKLKKIYVSIIQPRTDTPYTIAEYDEEALEEARKEIVGIVERAYAPDAPRNATPSACKYCRAKSVCPEAGGKMQTLAKNSLEGILTLTDEQLSEYNDAADVAESVIEAIRSETRRRLNSGSSIRGWELKPGRTTRTIENAEDAWCKIANAEILDAAEFAQCCKISVTSLEKAVVRNLKLKAKEGKEKLSEILGEVLATKQSEPVMSRTK